MKYYLLRSGLLMYAFDDQFQLSLILIRQLLLFQLQKGVVKQINSTQ
jgi:hypothetical protein